jgi:pimeloyl-ACP methyl ester carboxylesterase
VFAAHSTGTYIALVAAEMLPPRSLDRIVLLASTASPYYDLRPALRATRGGIDNYLSVDDDVLYTAQDYVRPADGQKGQRGAMAGRTGFHFPCGLKDCAEYANLRQYAWQPWYYGQGGHFVWTQPFLLRHCIVPVILAPPTSTPPTAALPK